MPPDPICIEYATDVIHGRIAASRWIYAAAKRFLDDLERTDIYMDWATVAELVAHFDRLTLVGDDSGRAFSLAAWQRWSLANIWGWRYREDDRRRVRLAVLQVARGNGKTTLMAGLCLWDMTRGDGRRVHVLANNEHQAEICLDTAKTMVARLESTDL
jgi:phage terminase large subunit-like protein